MQETLVGFLGREDSWRRDRLPTPVFLGFPCGSAGKESACSAGDLGLIPGLGRSPGEGKGYPLQYFGLENSTDCMVHGVTKSWTQLSTFTYTQNTDPISYFSKPYGPVCTMNSVQSLSRVQLFATPWTIQSMEFSRPKYWSG